MQRGGRRRRARGGRPDRRLPGGAGGAHQRRAPRGRHLRRGGARGGGRRAPSCASATTAAASTPAGQRARLGDAAVPASGCAGWPSGPGWWAASSTCARRPAAGTSRDPEDPMIRVLIADDHGIVRSGLRMLIDRQADMQVVAEATDGVEALESDPGGAPRRGRARRVDAAHDGPAGRARDPRARARHARAAALDARRRALLRRGRSRPGRPATC